MARRVVSFRDMNPNTSSVTRTLTIVLPESDWRALRTVEPDAIGWLTERIRERLESSALPRPAETVPSSESWGDDEY